MICQFCFGTGKAFNPMETVATMTDPIRNKIVGFSDSHDRLWKIEVADATEAITDYNWEITGHTPGLQELPEIGQHIHYGGNAYYVIPELQKRGFVVTEVEDRKCADD